MRHQRLKFRFRMAFAIVLSYSFLFSTAALKAQDTEITVQLNQPVYDCETNVYCVDVEFLSDTDGAELFGMNVRFFYDDDVLELIGFTDFQGGYGAVNPNPPYVATSSFAGPAWFNFNGPAEFINGAIQLVNPNAPPLLLNADSGTKLFQICFHVDDPGQVPSEFCPSLIWDLEQDPYNGGYLVGDDGVVITIVSDDPNFESDPAFENAVQFNWNYSGNGEAPYGEPANNVCISIDCAPLISCPADITLQCGDSTLPTVTGEATGEDICDGNITVTYFDEVIPGPCAHDMLINRRWIASNDCGLHDTCYQQIIITDQVAPVINCPPDITLTFPASTDPGETGVASASDNCDADPGITFDDFIHARCGFVESIQRVWSVSDDCGNISSCTQSILILNHGTICGYVQDDQDQPLAGVEIQLYADVDFDSSMSTADTLVSSILTDSTSGLYCFSDISPCNYILVEIQPPAYSSLYDYDLSPDPDGDDQNAGANNAIPVILSQSENDVDNNFSEINCNLQLPQFSFDTICSGGGAVFEADASDVGEVQYHWDFGSGATPDTAYGPGEHLVQYEANDENQAAGASVQLTITKTGCTSISDTVRNVLVRAIPDATIDASTQPGCYYTIREFKPVQDEIAAASYEWYFGPGAIPLQAYGYGPHEVQYTTTGVKTVILVIVTNSGALCSDTSSISFTITSCPGNITGKVKSTSGAGIGGVQVKLYADADQDGIADNNVLIKSASTVTSGTFSLVAITPGDYVIVQSQPANWISVDDGDTSPDGDHATNFDSLDNVIPVTVKPNMIDANNEFVESPVPGMISGVVFDDIDGNGLPGSTEGIPGVELLLYMDPDKNGLPDGEPVLESTATEHTGEFIFEDIPVGNYVLVQSNAAGYISVLDIDISQDLDSVSNSNQGDDIIPVSIILAEHDDHNYFIDEIECQFIVTNLNDAGTGSLRKAIDCAVDGDTITFHSSLAGQTIYITSSRLVIDVDLTILNEHLIPVIIQSNTQGLFEVGANASAEISGMKVISGLAGPPGAAFYNAGNLRLRDIHVVRNPSLDAGNVLIRNAPGSEIEFRGTCHIDWD